MAEKQLSVFISGTTSDLGQHRSVAMEACSRLGLRPLMFERLPASSSDPVAAMLSSVDEADIYLGIIGHRYGFVPPSYDVSFVEIEYRRASERRIPCLIFMMGQEHPVKPDDIEQGEGANKLAAFKERLLSKHTVNVFASPDELREQITVSLAPLVQKPSKSA